MLTVLNMLIVDLAFCERLYLCDLAVKGGSQNIFRTSFSDRATYRVRDFGNPTKI